MFYSLANYFKHIYVFTWKQTSVQEFISKPSRNGRVVKCAVLWHGRSWVQAPAQAIGSSLGSDLGATNACGYVWRLQVRGSKWLGCHAVYTLIQCTPLLVEKAGVAPDVTLGITARKQERVQARDPLRLWNPWGRTHKVQNWSKQWLHKLGLGPKNLKKRKKKRIYLYINGVNEVQKVMIGYHVVQTVLVYCLCSRK